LIFVVNTLFSLYILVVMLRFLLQWVRADFFNPISQFVVRVTQPILRPMRRVIPGLAGVDVSSLLLAIALQMVLLAVLALIVHQQVDPVYVLLRTPLELLDMLFNIYIFGIVIQAVLTWVSQDQYNPLQTVLYSLTEPVVRPFRQIMPLLGGIDLSPLAAIIVLQVLRMLVLTPLNQAVPQIF